MKYSIFTTPGRDGYDVVIDNVHPGGDFQAQHFDTFDALALDVIRFLPIYPRGHVPSKVAEAIVLATEWLPPEPMERVQYGEILKYGRNKSVLMPDFIRRELEVRAEESAAKLGRPIVARELAWTPAPDGDPLAAAFGSIKWFVEVPRAERDATTLAEITDGGWFLSTQLLMDRPREYADFRLGGVTYRYARYTAAATSPAIDPASFCPMNKVRDTPTPEPGPSLASRFQIGDTVILRGVVEAVAFHDGKVHYGVTLNPSGTLAPGWLTSEHVSDN